LIVCKGGSDLPGEKRFRTSFLGGFKKSDVNSYIEQLINEFEQKLSEKDKEIEALKIECRDYRAKYEELQSISDQIIEDRNKIAEVLIKARETADMMLEEARREALGEKKSLEDTIEKEREKLVDIRQEMKALKAEIACTLKKVEAQLELLPVGDETGDGLEAEAAATEEEELAQ